MIINNYNSLQKDLDFGYSIENIEYIEEENKSKNGNENMSNDIEYFIEEYSECNTPNKVKKNYNTEDNYHKSSFYYETPNMKNATLISPEKCSDIDEEKYEKYKIFFISPHKTFNNIDLIQDENIILLVEEFNNSNKSDKSSLFHIALKIYKLLEKQNFVLKDSEEDKILAKILDELDPSEEIFLEIYQSKRNEQLNQLIQPKIKNTILLEKNTQSNIHEFKKKFYKNNFTDSYSKLNLLDQN